MPRASHSRKNPAHPWPWGGGRQVSLRASEGLQTRPAFRAAFWYLYGHGSPSGKSQAYEQGYYLHRGHQGRAGCGTPWLLDGPYWVWILSSEKDVG